jgi:SAM-dependent methyltransferase
MATAVDQCVWCSSADVYLIEVALSRVGSTVYKAACCRRCGVRYAQPFDCAGLDYQLLQTKHRAYVTLRADNEWVREVLATGLEVYWAQLSATFLCEQSLDSRFVYVMRIALEAAQRGCCLDILEVGCNLGYVGGILRRLGHRYVGLDIQQSAIERAIAYYGPYFRCETVEHFAAHSPSKFDLVCAFEVIEHVTNPRELVETCISLTKPHGRVVITTPDSEFYPEGEWTADLPPIHLALFGRQAFRLLATDRLLVRFVNDLRVNDGGEFLRRRLRRLVWPHSPRKPHAQLPNLNPLDGDFAYGATTFMGWRLPRTRGKSRLIRNAVATLAGLGLGQSPAGGTLIAEFKRV